MELHSFKKNHRWSGQGAPLKAPWSGGEKNSHFHGIFHKISDDEGHFLRGFPANFFLRFLRFVVFFVCKGYFCIVLMLFRNCKSITLRLFVK